jgi:hypothetical protein
MHRQVEELLRGEEREARVELEGLRRRGRTAHCEGGMEWEVMEEIGRVVSKVCKKVASQSKKNE